MDFVEHVSTKKGYSVEDHRFISILSSKIVKRNDGHYEMPLPMCRDEVRFPNNRLAAVRRALQLKRKFKRNSTFKEHYIAFMNGILAGYAEKVPESEYGITNGSVNYIPHSGVYHPKKTNQIRVVFDCSAKYEGVCLNDYLLQGPDLMNGLIGILCRFRKEEVAIMADIKGMFHQFYVTPKDRDKLRFLWWDGSDFEQKMVEYRMKVHLFGAKSSPGCANFGLKRAADDGEGKFGEIAANFIRDDFYVDDGLKSLPTIQQAIELVKSSTEL
ncbi:uncharacterized protein [Antedon mediterranea]|uniref:uncharacterized protein n=1 Tax=Antedon mediterranea TaxID=105859 RepID=UPI003AF4C5BD